MAENVPPRLEGLAQPPASFLAGGGEMGERTRVFPWVETVLGPVDVWPQSLRTTLSIVLSSKFPMFLWWGEDLIQFYNDAYRPSLGKDGKHPAALGQRGQECWPEIWPVISPLIESVRSTGEATWSEDQLVPIYRNGALEDVYWTFGYSPVKDEIGKVAGVLVVCTETTRKVQHLQQLVESKDELLFAIEAAELGTWDYNPLTNRFKANDRLKAWFGLAEGEEMDLGLATEVMADRDRMRVESAIKQALVFSSGGYYDIEYTIIHPRTRKERLVRAKGRAWFGEDGVAYRFNGTLQDITQARKAEEEKQKLATMVEASQEFITLASLDTSLQYANPAALQLLGWDAIAGKKMIECVYPPDQQLARQLLAKLVENGSFSQEIRFVHAGSGRPFWLQWNAFTLRDIDSNDVIGLATVSPVISGRKEAERVLRESETRFRSLAQNSPDIITRHDPSFRYLYANPRIEQVTGIPPEAFSGKTYRELGLDEELCQLFDQHLSHVFTSQALHTLEYASPQGYMHSRMVPEYDDQGAVTSVLVLSTDISEMKKALEALQESETRFRLLADQVPHFIWMSGPGDPRQGIELEYSNPSFLSYMGESTATPFTGRMWDSVMHPDDRERVYEMVTEAWKVRQAYSVECRFREAASGQFRWILLKGVTRVDPQGTFIGYIGTGVDIDEQKRMFDELTLKNAQLERINNDLDNFMYTASHDLKAPISNIEGLLRVLLKGLPADIRQEERTQKVSGLIGDSVERFKRTITHLTDVVKLQKESNQEMELVNLREVIEEVRLDLAPQIQAAKAVLDIGVPDYQQIRFSLKNLRSVVYNLLSNALKYHSPDRTPLVQLGCREEKECYILSFTDNGLGMDLSKETKLFGMFARLHDHVEGSGVGLYMIKKMVENAGGKIEVESQLGVGSTFRVYFPKGDISNSVYS